jgi:hypothetical protein
MHAGPSQNRYSGKARRAHDPATGSAHPSS